MAVKPGDTVRYLNAVGGGRVTRIVDGIAYVDEDGFETPVLLRECVVVASPAAEPARKTAAPAAPAASKYTPQTTPAHSAPEQTKLPVVETATGNVLNITLGFEPTDIKALSQSSFEAYIVNDSNYYLYISVSSRSTDDREWTHRFDGIIEPNIQEFAFELENTALAHFDHLSVQYIAFKRDRAFEAKQPGALQIKVDATKFAKLHCFRPNPYFDGPVIAFDIAHDDRVQEIPVFDSAAIEQGMKAKRREIKAQQKQEQRAANLRSAKPASDIIEVDLHADELLDTTAGLSPADILNLQIDRFQQVMDSSLRYPGRKIVFIHGKGEGVLRQAIMKELSHRYKGHDVQDASFREYGFGATQVTIRATDGKAAQSADNRGNKKRR